MLYRPPFKEALAMYERIVNKHAEDLARVDLIWEPIQTPGGDWQLCPFIVTDFKGVL
jgi:hypothetical protein